MTRKEQLEFCRKCANQKFDYKHGIICGLTENTADFEEKCENFKPDENALRQVTESKYEGNVNTTRELRPEVLTKLKNHQDFYFAFVGGLLAALISAVLWAVVTIAIQIQIGYMAIGVGLLVGFSVRFFGAGIDQKFGYLGALLSLAGCLIGNLFGQVGFIAKAYSLGYFETLALLNLGLIKEIMVETFSPIDLLFYAIAVYEGYKFAFRRVSAQELRNLQSDDFEGSPPYARLRMPLVILSIGIIGLFILRINKGVNGTKTYYYDSGSKMSEGILVKSKEHGKWTYWYENGNVQSTGFYINGIPDSSWEWYSESGNLLRTGHYKKGLEHGIWMSYYESGTLSDSGSYLESRMHGLWRYWYENGYLRQTGFYKKNYQDGHWKIYFENGRLNAEGRIANGKHSGKWITYYENGQLASQLIYRTDDEIVIENSWDVQGKQTVKNGEGYFEIYSDKNRLIQQGKVENGRRVGKWMSYYDDGKQKELGKYENNTYIIINYWDQNGDRIITDGAGKYVSIYPDGKTVFETGEVLNGFRDGIWKIYYETSGNIYQELVYSKGKLSGLQKYYFESGQLYSSGEIIDDLREGEWTWYYENGNISSTVRFKSDKKEGKQILWSEVGEKVKEEYYENGELTEERLL